MHPCDESSLRGAIEATEMGIIRPVLVGPAARIKAVATQAGLDVSAFRLVDAPHSHAAAAAGVTLIREGAGEVLMKGSLHTDELMHEVKLDARRDVAQNAIDMQAARIKGITSAVAGRARIRTSSSRPRRTRPGIVLGARVPIVLASRADSVRSRMASCAIAVLLAEARRNETKLSGGLSA